MKLSQCKLLSPMIRPEEAALWHIFGGYALPAIRLAISFRIFEGLLAGRRSAETLANYSGLKIDEIRRIIDILRGFGLLKQQGDRLELPASVTKFLTTDGASVNPVLEVLSEVYNSPQYLHAVSSEIAAHLNRFFRANAVENYYTRWWSNPLELKAVYDTFTKLNNVITPLVAEAFPELPGATSVLDVGGGRGELSLALQARFPSLLFSVFDHPSVRRECAPSLPFVAGNFFQAVPGGHDVYILKWVVHDWPDDRAKHLLTNLADALLGGARAYLVETIVPADEPNPAISARQMIRAAFSQGRERSKVQFLQLLASAGLQLISTLPVAGCEILDLHVLVIARAAGPRTAPA